MFSDDYLCLPACHGKLICILTNTSCLLLLMSFSHLKVLSTASHFISSAFSNMSQHQKPFQPPQYQKISYRKREHQKNTPNKFTVSLNKTYLKFYPQGAPCSFGESRLSLSKALYVHRVGVTPDSLSPQFCKNICMCFKHTSSAKGRSLLG